MTPWWLIEPTMASIALPPPFARKWGHDIDVFVLYESKLSTLFNQMMKNSHPTTSVISIPIRSFDLRRIQADIYAKIYASNKPIIQKALHHLYDLPVS